MTGEILPVDYKRRAQTALASLEKDNSICKGNRELISRFTRDCYAEGLSHARVSKYVSLLSQISRRLDKEFPTVTESDLREMLKETEISDYTAWTKRDYKIAVKRFWKWLDGGEAYPKMVRWVRTTLDQRKLKHPSEMLTEDDIKALLNAAEHPRDRALIAVAWETGCRAGELLTMRIRSYRDGGDVGYLDVMGKTGARRIPIVAAIPHLTRWLAFHPARDNPANPMWVVTIGADKDYLTYAGFIKMLSVLVSRAGLRKRVHPHLFRHSRATFLANKLTEAQMKHFFGWTQGSEMAATYVHLSGRDIQDSILQMYGKKTAEESYQPQINLTKCHRCEFDNSTESKFCGRCGSPTKCEGSVAMSEKLQLYDRLMTSLLQDGRVQGILSQKMGQDPDLLIHLKELLMPHADSQTANWTVPNGHRSKNAPDG